MHDLTKRLFDLDTEIKKCLGQSDLDQTKELISSVLKDVAEHPGRGPKAWATYVLERMADIAHDIEDEDEDFASRAMAVFKLIDSGLSHVAYMANPDSAGRYLEAFDQITLPARVPFMRDPEEVRRREELAVVTQQRIGTVLDQKRRGAIKEPKTGGNIIIVPDQL